MTKINRERESRRIELLNKWAQAFTEASGQTQTWYFERTRRLAKYLLQVGVEPDDKRLSPFAAWIMEQCKGRKI